MGGPCHGVCTQGIALSGRARRVGPFESHMGAARGAGLRRGRGLARTFDRVRWICNTSLFVCAFRSLPVLVTSCTPWHRPRSSGLTCTACFQKRAAAQGGVARGEIEHIPGAKSKHQKIKAPPPYMWHYVESSTHCVKLAIFFQQTWVWHANRTKKASIISQLSAGCARWLASSAIRSSLLFLL